MRGLIDEMLLLAALDRGEIPSGDQADAGAAAEAVVADRRARRAWRNRDLRFMATRAQRVAGGAAAARGRARQPARQRAAARR